MPVFDLIRQFVAKYITQLAKIKKKTLLEDLVFKIRLNIKFPIREEMLKNMSAMIRNSFNYFESFS